MKKLLPILLFLSISCSVFALDVTQATTLRTTALAEPSIAQAIANGDDSSVAAWFNTASTFIVWKNSISCKELSDGAIVWTAVDALTAGKARIWEWLCKYETINPSKANVRQGLQDAFGAGSATVIAATPLIKRAATNAEKALATGTGTTATPGLLTFEGRISVNDVSSILRP